MHGRKHERVDPCMINEDKKSNKINNQVYLDIINTGIDDLENTYGCFEAIYGNPAHSAVALLALNA